MDDAAQSYGASWQGRDVGHLGVITATSFSLPSLWAVMAMAERSSPNMINWQKP